MSEKYLIVGGNSGIGKALVQRLIGNGAEVHVALRRGDAMDFEVSSKQGFDAENPRELVLPETLDGLVYCPGSITLKPFHRLAKDDFLKELEINLFGAIEVLKQAMQPLRKSGSGSVVLFSTIAVETGMPFHASIAAAKGALEGLARSLAAEWAPSVRVNVIAPSLHDTPLAHPLVGDEKRRAAAMERHPLKSVGDAEDAAALAHFLLGKESAFITGQTLRPDGGLSSLRLF